MFGMGSFAEAYLALTWSPVVFGIWYVFGAVLNPAWLGHGTLNLLVKKRWIHVITALLAVGSLVAIYLMATTPLDSTEFNVHQPISVQYAQIMPARAQAPVRSATSYFAGYGTLTLVGGALYSAFLFWRKRVLPNRMWGNIMIAVGALAIGFASALARLGFGEYLYIGELLAAILMYGGFRMAAGPAAEPVVAAKQESSAPA